MRTILIGSRTWETFYKFLPGDQGGWFERFLRFGRFLRFERFHRRSVVRNHPSHKPQAVQCAPMTCPNCSAQMTERTLEGHLGTKVMIDSCEGCQAFWFDGRESLQLSPGATLELFQTIG